VRDDGLTRAAEAREAFGPWPGAELVYAPSPHTLFTTAGRIVQELTGRARASHVKVSLHFCEHAAERAAIERGVYPFVVPLRPAPGSGGLPPGRRSSYAGAAVAPARRRECRRVPEQDGRTGRGNRAGDQRGVNPGRVPSESGRCGRPGWGTWWN